MRLKALPLISIHTVSPHFSVTRVPLCAFQRHQKWFSHVTQRLYPPNTIDFHHSCGSHHHTEFKSRILFYQVILTFVVCCPHGPITHEVLDQGLFKASGHGITVMDSPSVPAASRDASFLHRHCHELYGSNPVEPSSGAGCHGFESNPGSQCVPVVPRDLIWHWETWI